LFLKRFLLYGVVWCGVVEGLGARALTRAEVEEVEEASRKQLLTDT